MASIKVCTTRQRIKKMNLKKQTQTTSPERTSLQNTKGH